MASVMAIAYDQRTGRIVHTHHFYSVTGRPTLTPDEITEIVRRDALSVASADQSAIAVALVNEHRFDRNRVYKIDVDSKGLVDGELESAGLNSAAGISIYSHAGRQRPQTSRR